ncbi:MAG TPA: zf-HC2 domain-containing protein [Vicinamibacteria bacterium]|nr:zf-HC2 domain-containing protein [Vicinamibacteria bacterium]
MILAHLRRRRLVGLLAAGVLEGRERDEARAHLAECPRCREEHDALRAVVAAMEADPLRDVEPGVPLSFLVARVEREVERALVPRTSPRRWLVALPATAAVLAAAVLVPAIVARLRPAPEAARAEIPPAEASPLLTEEALARIERNLAREHAVRYLSEAGEVLVAVAATGVDCDRADERLDVGRAPARSRELLERRAMVVRGGGEAVSSARGVLDDVELALREVAELPSCVRRRDVERLRREVEERQLLMRIRLMTRELEG